MFLAVVCTLAQVDEGLAKANLTHHPPMSVDKPLRNHHWWRFPAGTFSYFNPISPALAGNTEWD